VPVGGAGCAGDQDGGVERIGGGRGGGGDMVRKVKYASATCVADGAGGAVQRRARVMEFR
jgi:hypothetical protein